MRLVRAAGPHHPRPGRRRLVLTGSVVGTAALALMITPGSSIAVPTVASAASPLASATSGESTASSSGDPRLARDFDVRQQGPSATVLAARTQRMSIRPVAGIRLLHRQLGVQGVVSMDPLTGTPRNLAKLDGYLTGTSSRSPAAIVGSYVRSHAAALGLDAGDLATLRLRKDYTDISGTHHLSFVQYSGSIPVFGNGLKANVSRSGRLVSLQGSPVHHLAGVRTTARVSASAARATAIRNVSAKVTRVTTRRTTGAARATTFSDDDRASLVVFQTVAGPRLAWLTLTTPGSAKMFLHVVDATSGAVLLRRNLVDSDRGAVWEYWPGRTNGGRQNVVDLTKRGWLKANSPRLAGNFTHVWSDVNDDNRVQSSEEVRPGTYSYRFPFVDFTATDGRPCTAGFKCSWNNRVANSWNRNRKQNAVQVFYYVNRMHDHLFARPIGFNRRAGNFEAIDNDAVQAQPDDGANTANGLPDSNHVDNANMGTPPDGMSPDMQMYLFNDPAAQGEDPFLQSNGGDEADIVYHEYTHGLSGRLVVDASGISTLGDIQAGAMGEAWSDWYAMDYLNNLKFQADTAAPGDVRVGQYVGKARNLIRTQPLDCPVGTTSAKCPGTADAGRGGYTYGDFGKISGSGPEVHADGEIWGETLWDLRHALGSRLTESLVTRAMELSPANPSFLDERNSILQADTVVNGGRARATIWRVFAHRGMGYFAGTVNGDDAQPVQNFRLPPAPGTPTGYLTGIVTTTPTGAPAAGATVAFGGHDSGFPGSYATTTAASGRYTIRGVFRGTYPTVWAGGNGYDRVVRTVTIAAGGQTLNWSLRRDWAALAGGADVTGSNDTTGAPFGCGPAQLFDQSAAQGWSAERTVTGGAVTPVYAVVKLPRAVDVSEVAIDPSATCGDGGSASTGPYTLETSTNGTTWRPAASGTFTPADQGRSNSPALAAGSGTAVRFLRYTMRDSQVDQVGTCPGAFSGCDFIDSSEIEVYGTATP